jgi:2-(1,2-epoxy-1,2-dihydrophenyl)acetyl-CoA isomerase
MGPGADVVRPARTNDREDDMAALERSDQGAVRRLTLNRPEARNALNFALLQALRAELAAAAEPDAGVRCLILAGAGKGFCAGADVREWAEVAAAGNDRPEGYDWVGEAHRLVTELAEFPRPTIAVVNGAAAGAGVDLALACDFRFAADDARFICSYTRMGYPPDAGGTWLLPRVIGPEAAKRFALTGAPWHAQEALTRGMVGEVHPAAEVLGAAEAFAAELATGPTVAQMHAKRLIDTAHTRSLAEQLAAETLAGQACKQTDDAKEAMRAAVERRAPVFIGR